MTYTIATLTLENGARLGIGPLPRGDAVEVLERWGADAILAMTSSDEFGTVDLSAAFGARWNHLHLLSCNQQHRQPDW